MAVQPFTSDLASARYSTAAASFLQLFGPPLPGATDAGVHYDGDFTVASRVGQPIPEFPFADKGDALTEIVKQRYWQLATSFRSQALSTPSETRSDLLLIDENDFHDEGGGIISWTREYANQPQPRDDWETFSYGFQYASRDTSTGDLKIGELPFTVASRVRSEFFHVKDLAQWPVLLAPRVVPIVGSLYYQRGQGNYTLSASFFVSTDPQILAEDSSLHVWKYPWMERRSRWIAGPKLEFFGTVLNLTS